MMVVETPRFSVICADPPWKHEDPLGRRGAAVQYPLMSVEEICAYGLPMSMGVAEHALLCLWRLSSMQREALAVCAAWGFEPKSEIVWLRRTSHGKRHFGMGRTVRNEHETALVATRGRPVIRARNIRSTFEAPTGRHSEKPEKFYREIVERLSPGPYLELFSRRQRSGWTCIGNELA